jgi:4-amino-4-deoxy-L-arabinose transferase-like glycosyltransferase
MSLLAKISLDTSVEPVLSNKQAAHTPEMPYSPLLVILILGLFVRLVLLYMTKDTGLAIVDEQHYHTLALNLVHGHGFAWAPGVLTSIRPPLYPAFIAFVWTLTGTESLLLVRLAQVVLSLTSVWLLYRLGLLLFNHRIALWAAAGFCFYPSLIAFNFLLLSEVLFTFLLILFALWYVRLLKTERAPIAWGSGCLLGLAALTRSILWLFPLVLVPLALYSLRSSLRHRVHMVVCLTLGYALVVAPWAVRNTRLQGVFTVVNTMGGITLRMGNYEHTPLYRAWDPITLQGETSIFHDLHQEHPEASAWTEGRKEKWATKKALAYMREQPLLTLKRAIIKCASLWGLEREIIAAWQQGLYHPPQWFVIFATLAITLSYVTLMLLASLGVFLACPSDRRAHRFFLLLMAFIAGLHTLTFGHSRYHLPFVPLLLLYAAAALYNHSWLCCRESLHRAAAPITVWVVLGSIWGREVLLIDADRIRGFLRIFFP